MNHEESRRQTGGTELRWLSRYGWLFPLLGFPLGLLISGGLWSCILLHRSFLPDHLTGWITLKGLVMGAVFSGLPLLWWIGIQLEHRTGGRLRRWPTAPLLGVLGVLLVEVFLRSQTGQSILWQSVRTRSGSQYLAREISLLRENAASLLDPVARERPGLVLMGSSQMVYAVDPPHLETLSGLPVFRRAVAGLFPTELVASQGFADFNAQNQLVLMLSGFDLGARDDLYTDAIRPLATPEGMVNVWSAAQTGFRFSHWHSFVDLFVAAHCDMWRSRDYARFLMEHPFKAAHLVPEKADATEVIAQKTAYEQLGNNPQMVDLCKKSLDRFFREMAGRCKQIIVFEGRVNPAYPSGTLEAMSTQMRDFLLKQEQLGHIRYVPLSEQNLELPAAFWKDMTHVNPEGRKLITEMFSRILMPPPPQK